MDALLVDNELNQWFSTYGLITAERILGRYHIHIPANQLLTAVKNPANFYYLLLQVPLKNIFNGILLQQANDYHVYAQKLFIDYLLSGEASKDEEAQGALTRESLEEERKQLVILGEEFHKKELEHNSLIATSQASIIAAVNQWRSVLNASIDQISATLKRFEINHPKSTIENSITYVLAHSNLDEFHSTSGSELFIKKMNESSLLELNTEITEQLITIIQPLIDVNVSLEAKIAPYIEQSKEMDEIIRSFRSQFYDTILRAMQLIRLLPDYRINEQQDIINRESLYFNQDI